MKLKLMLCTILLSIFPVASFSATCAGPAPCDYVPPPITEPVGPDTYCIRDVCSPVTYQWVSRFVTASSLTSNGAPIMGQAGPCWTDNHADCPDIARQAFDAMTVQGFVADRYERYGN